MLEWFGNLPAWARFCAALVIMGIGVGVAIWATRFWPAHFFDVAGLVIAGVGFALLCVAGRSESEKRGYRD